MTARGAVTMRSVRYIPELDGLRCLAVAAVVAAHAEIPGLHGGGIGVDVFFVISGFIITRLLVAEHDRTGEIRFRGFYLRRAARLLPALYVLAAISAVLFALVRPFHTDQTFTGIVASLGYASSYVRIFGTDLGWFGHTWSLSVEETFYVFWPLLLLLGLKTRNPRVFVAAVCVLAIAYRIGLSLAGASPDWLYNGPDARAEQLLIGALLAVIPIQGLKRARLAWTVAGCAGAAFLLYATVRPHALPNNHTGVSTLTGVAGAALIAWSLSGAALPALVLTRRPILGIGQRSYGIYLWHLPLLGVLDLKGHPHRERVLARGLALLLTLGAAATSFRFVEKPLLRRSGSSRAQQSESTTT